METVTLSKKEEWLQALPAVSIFSHAFSPLVKKAEEALQLTDFPTTRVEDWKYTRTTRISANKWTIAKSEKKADITPFLIDGLDAAVYVFIDGFFQAHLSRLTPIEGVSVQPITELSASDQAALQELLERRESAGEFFTALHTARATDGLFIRVKKNTQAAKSIHCLFLQTTEQTFGLPFVGGIVEEHANLHVVYTFAALNNVQAFTSMATDWEVKQNASFTIDKIQQEGDASFHLSQENIYQLRDSRFTINTLTVDGNWVRNNLNIRLKGENCNTHLNGVYLPRGTQHVDNHTLVDHTLPHCESNELYKGVISDQSKAVFNGKVYVRIDAQKTNAYQTNANILMSNDASVNTKPELEIYADDVKCSHGTTTGQFNEEALFYLKARGIGAENAKKLLTAAFVGEVLSKVEHEGVRQYVMNQLQTKDVLWM